MGLRFYRRVSLLPGVRLNVGTRGTSLSLGHGGFWYTLGPHGRRRATLGFPGTGISYVVTGSDGRSHRVRSPAPSAWGNLAWIVVIAAFWVFVFSKGPAVYSR